SIRVIVLIIEFVVVFKPSCTKTCGKNSGSKLQNALETKVTPTTVVLTDIPLVTSTGEVWGIIVSIPVVGVLYVSAIRVVTSAPVIPTVDTSQAPASSAAPVTTPIILLPPTTTGKQTRERDRIKVN
ncbi:unnamed protein product, partial [Rotaria sp. Silwood2]